MTEMREIAKALARRDREAQTALVKRRRRSGLKQSDIDQAFGFPAGWTHDLEAYDSDPTLSDLRRYEAYITLTEITTPAEGTGQPTNQTATGSPSGGPEPLEGT